MPDITLRAYLNEIEDLIDHAQLDEAIAHCRHILSHYPKHIDSYRLLGKALLEQGRHSDAADIFQRVLSAVPDDFVSHVGMAIIREDESNLDGAIWHMERAFEAQPSNGAIQEELRRLYGRRDGLEPEKIRLTRSALARTYAKGELYQQAIIELQKSLADEPERLDLRVLFAQALWHTNQKAEAAETCVAILEKLPYCREANRILADIWLSSGRPEEASLYRKRVEALDPYEAFAERSSNGAGASTALAQSVRLPKLEWSPAAAGKPADQTPDWMTALGVAFEQPQTAQEQLPAWLSESSAAAVGAPRPAASGEMPDWLRDLGAVTPQEPAAAPSGAGDDWLASLRTTAASATTVTDWLGAAEPSVAATPPGAETPDWLAGLNVGLTEGSAEAAATTPDWLAGLGATGAETAPSTGPSEATPDWLAELGAAQPAQASPFAGAETPDWLAAQSAQPEPEAAVPEWLSPSPASVEPAGGPPDWLAGASTPPPGPQELVLDWLSGAGKAPAAGAAATPEDRLPEWLRQPEEEKPSEPPAEIPDWLKGTTAAGEPGLAPAEVPDWLRSPAAEEQPAGSLERGDLPDWIRSLAPETPAQPAPAPEPPVSKAAAPAAPAKFEAPPAVKPEAPAWLRGEVLEEQPAASVPEWLRPPVEPTPISPASPTPAFVNMPPEDLASAELPEWLRPLAEESAATLPESVVDWLAQLAARERQSAPEVKSAAVSSQPPFFADDTLLPPAPTKPEVSALDAATEEPEVWVAPEAAPQPPTPSPVPQARAEPPRPTLPPVRPIAWQEEPPAPLPTPTPSPTIESEDETMAWLEALAAKHGAKEEEMVTAPEKRSGQLPRWLRVEAPEGVAAEPAAPPPAQVPDWLAAVEEPEPEPISAPVPLPPPTESAPDWLAPPEPPLAAPTPMAELPDWLRAAEPPPPPEPGMAVPTPADELPSWLKSLERPPEIGPAIAAPPPAEGVPDWLKAAEPPQEVIPVVAAPTPVAETPAWLGGVEEPAPSAAQPEAPAALPSEGVPDWVQPAPAYEPVMFTPAALPAEEIPEWLRPPEAGIAAPTPSAAPLGSEDETLAWLESLAAKHGAKEEEMVTRPEERVEQPPAWLEEMPQAEAAPPMEAAALPTDGMPDWLRQAMKESEPGLAEAPASAMPAWLQVEAEPEPGPVETPASELPPWLRGEAEPEPAVPAAAEALPAVPAFSDEDALGWLEEGLAAKHGAKEEEFVTPPEARAEAMPEWVREIPEAPAPAVPQPLAEPEPSEVVAPPPAMMPESTPVAPIAPPVAPPISPPPMPPRKDTTFLPTWEEVTGGVSPAPPVVMQPTAEWPEGIWPPEGAEVPPPAPIAPAVQPTPLAVAPRFVAPAPEPAAIAPIEPVAAPPAKPKPRPAKAGRKARPSAEPPELRLTAARLRLKENSLSDALELYDSLIKSNEKVDQVIADLESASERDPANKQILRTLGDAYMRDNRLQKALDTYRQALGQF